MSPERAAPDFISIDPAQNDSQENYKLLIGSVLPRPIAFVSTRSPAGLFNLAPFSFFTAVCAEPPTILFCPMVRGSDGQKKDTLRNIEDTREFVVNIVSEDIVTAMNTTAGEFPYGVSEFEQAGLTPALSVVVQPPRVLEAPVSLECKLQQVLTVGENRVGSGYVVLGTVVQFHVRSDLFQRGRIDTALLKPVARLAGAFYCPVRDVFEIQRPG